MPEVPVCKPYVGGQWRQAAADGGGAEAIRLDLGAGSQVHP
ncbi:hypothetical protein ACFXJ5_24360 [Streptomyces sp. NPDC059373]